MKETPSQWPTNFPNLPIGISTQTVAWLLAGMFGILQIGCSGADNGPPSVKETSDARPALADRIKFVEQYVTFRRKYNELDYDVYYQNNGGGRVPGPSEWDIKLVAKIPNDQLIEWLPVDIPSTEMETPDWVSEVSSSIPTKDINEWYEVSHGVIGFDRTNSVVVYRNVKN